MKKLSVVISAFNEEKKISDCLSSVSFADEIILVDNESTDMTVSIAKKYNAKIYSRPNNLMLNINKNFGFIKAKNDWVLCLDADERITSELQKEISEKINNSSGEINGYAIPRKNIIFGKWIKHTGWYPDYQLRLFRKGKGKFAEQHVHEQMEVDGQIEKITNPMTHDSYKSISEFLIKLFTIYAINEAEAMLKSETGTIKNGELIHSTYKFSWREAVRRSVSEFINRFYTQKGYKDGIHGLMLSILMAFYYFVVHAYIWEKAKFQESEENLRSNFEEEIKKIKTGGYWTLTASIEEEKNSIKKIYLRIKRKFLVIRK